MHGFRDMWRPLALGAQVLAVAASAALGGCTCGPAADDESVVGAQARPAEREFTPPEVVASPAEDRALISAYREGNLGPRLARGGLLLVDPGAPADVAEVEVILLRGVIASPPREPARLRQAFGVDGRPGRRSVLRSGEPGRPHLFRGIRRGPYTACVIFSRGAAPGGGEAVARLADEVAAARAAGGGEPLSLDAIAAIHGRVVDDVDAPPLPASPPTRAEEVRCVTLEVRRDPATRVVDLRGAAADPESIGEGAR